MRTLGAVLKENGAEFEAVYKVRGRLWPDIRRPKPLTTLKSHLGAINGILETQYGAKVVAVNKRNDRFRIEVLPWPDNLLEVWRAGLGDKRGGDSAEPGGHVMATGGKRQAATDSQPSADEIVAILADLGGLLTPAAA